MKINRVIARLAMATCALPGVVCPATAAPIQFEFTFASPTSPARATGTITYENLLFPNPALEFDVLVSGPEVLQLTLNVTGATAGNGSFGLDDFQHVIFASRSVLELARDLVGQPTASNPWGATDQVSADCAQDAVLGGSGGDFNLFGKAGVPSAPTGVWYFTLRANGGLADCMVLTSMR